jgi:hypothetical protein
MIARCARCQGTFTTDHFGLQTCPHCGSELLLSDPSAPPGAQPPSPPPPPQAPPPGASAPPPAAPPAGALPPPPPPPPGGYGPPGGGWPPPGQGGWARVPPPGARGPAPDELPAPFAERKARGFFASFFETWKLVATQPQEFFRRVRVDQTGAAVLFGVLASTVGNAVAALYNLASGPAAMRQLVERMPPDQAGFWEAYLEFVSGGAIWASILLTPVLTAVLMYVAAGIVHLLLVLFRGANRPFDATLTVVAYAHGLNLLLAVPGCGFVLAAAWGLVVLVVGLGEAQRCGTGKAAAAVLAPAALVCVCCCGAASLSLPVLLKGLQDAASQGGQQTTTL